MSKEPSVREAAREVYSATVLDRDELQPVSTGRDLAISGESARFPPANSVNSFCGIFNLDPSRRAIFEELFRVVRPTGCVFVSEIALDKPLPQAEIQRSSNWFA